jgi:hypothetical protein
LTIAFDILAALLFSKSAHPGSFNTADAVNSVFPPRESTDSLVSENNSFGNASVVGFILFRRIESIVNFTKDDQVGIDVDVVVLVSLLSIGKRARDDKELSSRISSISVAPIVVKDVGKIFIPHPLRSNFSRQSKDLPSFPNRQLGIDPRRRQEDSENIFICDGN